MYLTTHAAIGGMAGILSKDPIMGFTFGFLSHIILDAIPHEQKESFFSEPPSMEAEKRRFFKQKILPMIFDIIVMLILFVFLFLKLNQENSLYFSSGFLGGVFPDLILGLTMKSRFYICKKYFRFHDRIHFIFFKNPYLNIYKSIFFQFVLTIFAAYIILNV